MISAPSRLPWVLVVLPLACGVAAGCGDDDACVDEDVSVQVTVDGRAPSQCASWELQVRACATGGDCAGGCGACVDGAPDPECEPIDACENNVLSLAPGDYKVCVHAELVNGGLSSDGCTDTTVAAGGGAVAVAVDTDDAFPCIRDWTFNGSLCCNDVVGACVPPD